MSHTYPFEIYMKSPFPIPSNLEVAKDPYGGQGRDRPSAESRKPQANSLSPSILPLSPSLLHPKDIISQSYLPTPFRTWNLDQQSCKKNPKIFLIGPPLKISQSYPFGFYENPFISKKEKKKKSKSAKVYSGKGCKPSPPPRLGAKF